MYHKKLNMDTDVNKVLFNDTEFMFVKLRKQNSQEVIPLSTGIL